MKDGGPAFPIGNINGQISYKGMPLRDYYAGQALPTAMKIAAKRIEHTKTGQDITECAVRLSFQIADAMIKAREKE